MSKKYLVRLVSDLHLEVRNGIPTDIFPEEETPNITIILVLAGDIGDPFSEIYKTFLERAKCRYEIVIVVPGNHEFYNDNVIASTDERNKDMLSRTFNQSNRKTVICEAKSKNRSYQQCIVQMETVCRETSCTFLNNSCTTIDNKIKFIGSILWGHISEIERTLIENEEPNVFKYTKMGDQKFTIDIFNDLNKKCIKYLNEEIAKTDSHLKVIVVTHYAPSDKMLAERFVHSTIQSTFYCNVENLFRPPVVAWFSGHVHDGKTIYINGIESTSNSYGVEKEVQDYGFYRKDYSLIVS